MAASWEYTIEFILNQIFGISIFNQPLQLILFASLAVSGIFLIGIIHALYNNYQKNKMLSTLLFLVGMIFLIMAVVVAILLRFVYTSWGLPGLGDLLSIMTSYSILVCILCVNLFSIKVTFPRHYKIVLTVLLIISAIMVITGTWATIQGPPYSRVIGFQVVFSLEIMLIRLFGLIPFFVIPISLFFYFANNIRKEGGEKNKSKSSLSIWLGIGILFFAIAIISLTISPTFQIILVLFVPAAIIFYVCFSMPDWFKRKIGWSE